MSDSNEYQWILICLAKIEQNLGWGTSADWNNFDFEKLSNEIESKTTVLLSVTTLKRLWGKIKYDHDPSLTTLNTLAQYLRYEDWRTFKLDQTKKESIVKEKVIPFEEKKVLIKENKIRKYKTTQLVFATLAFLGLIFIFALTAKDKPALTKRVINPDLYSFMADKVLSTGVPNSVVFHYDATAASTSDSVFIVQTWDMRRKTLVDKNNHEHSALYYFPGYFKSKLIIDSIIVKTHDLQIATDGWLGLIQNDALGVIAPTYFDTKDINQDGVQEVDKAVLKKYEVPLLPVSPKVRFFNQRDLGDLMNDNFIFETSIRNDHKEGDNACQFVQVLIQCKDDIIIIPLSASPCIGDLRLIVAGITVDSKSADLSGFGADLSQWTDLKVICENKLMKFYVNNKEAFHLTFLHPPVGIVGVQYRFNGVGAVKNTSFTNKTGKIVL
ncbi:MAG: hypothetical protein ABI761_17830 [Saprospiraceae bacterium]